MFGSSPPQFRLPFDRDSSSSRRNSLEQNIWAPLLPNHQGGPTPAPSLQPRPHFHSAPSAPGAAPGTAPAHFSAQLPSQLYFLPHPNQYQNQSYQNPPSSQFGSLTFYEIDSRGRNSSVGHSMMSMPPPLSSGATQAGLTFSHPNQGNSQSNDLAFAPGLWASNTAAINSAKGQFADPSSSQALPAWETTARRHSVGDVFPGLGLFLAPYLAHAQLLAGWNMFGANLSGFAAAPAQVPTSPQEASTSQLNVASANTTVSATAAATAATAATTNASVAPTSASTTAPSPTAQVHEYFSLDPHKRVKVTAEYLAQRFFDEEKYLGDSYQLPKFPVESLLHDYQLVLVAFKAGRIDVFYLPSSLEQEHLGVGDLVMVEADRGRDLGKIVKMNISIDEARLLKLLQFLEQQAALCDNSSLNDLSVKQLHGPHAHHAATGAAPPTLHFPKPIIGRAQHNEIIQILNKKQDEEKACRLCLAKIASTSNMLSSNEKLNQSLSQTLLSLSDLMQMKLVDAEYQFDRKKLIFYYSTSRRIDFRDLVRELFRIYKTRIWMCAVNGIPYVPNHKRRPLVNQGQQTHQVYQNSPLGASAQSLPLGLESVPRKLPMGPDAPEEKDSDRESESFVLKSLVDTLNH